MREQNVLRRISFICHTVSCAFQYRANSAGISKDKFTIAFLLSIIITVTSNEVNETSSTADTK